MNCLLDLLAGLPRCGRVLIGRGRDAADVPFLRSFGAHELTGFQVITEEVGVSAAGGPNGDGCAPALAGSLQA